MTQDEKRIAIYESLGWKFKQQFLGDPYGTAPESWESKHDAAHWNCELYEIPDIFNSLQACHEAEMSLPVWMDNGDEWLGTRHHFRHELCLMCSQPIHATAAERAEALYQTLCTNK